MALTLSSGRPVAAPSASPFAPILRWFAARRRVRKQRQVLRTLMEFEPHRLADLGLCRQDLIEALIQSRTAPAQAPGADADSDRFRFP